MRLAGALLYIYSIFVWQSHQPVHDLFLLFPQKLAILLYIPNWMMAAIFEGQELNHVFCAKFVLYKV